MVGEIFGTGYVVLHLVCGFLSWGAMNGFIHHYRLMTIRRPSAYLYFFEAERTLYFWACLMAGPLSVFPTAVVTQFKYGLRYRTPLMCENHPECQHARKYRGEKITECEFVARVKRLQG